MVKVLPYSWTPADIYDAQIVWWAAHTDMLRQEEFTDHPSNVVTTPLTLANGTQQVGSIMCPLGGHVFTANGPLYRPFLQSDVSGRNAFLRFGSGNQASSLILQNSYGLLRPIYTHQCYTLAFWVRMVDDNAGGAHDSSNQCFMDNCELGNTKRGFVIQRDAKSGSTALVEFDIARQGAWIGYNTGGSLLAGTAPSVGTWTPMVLMGRGPGNVNLYIGGALVNNVFVPGSGGTTIPIAHTSDSGGGDPIGSDASYLFTIGASASNSEKGQFDMDSFVFTSSPMSASDLTNWYNFNPPANSNSVLRVKGTASGKLLPTDISHSHYWHDMTAAVDPANDAPLMFTDSTKATAVNVVNPTTGYQNLGYVENRLGAHLERYLYYPGVYGATSWPQAPVWTPGEQNGHPGAVFSGSWNNVTPLSQPNVLMLNQPTPPCDSTWYFVLQQNSNSTHANPGGQSGTYSAAGNAVGAHVCGSSAAGGSYVAIGGEYHTSPIAFVEHLAAESGGSGSLQAPITSTYQSITFSSITNAVTGGVYLPLQIFADYTNGSTPTFFCAATGLYLYYVAGSSVWVLSSNNGSKSSAYWQTTNTDNDILATNGTYGNLGTASGGAGQPVGVTAGGPIAVHVYHGQQGYGYTDQGTGARTRLGVDGYWGPWVLNPQGGGVTVRGSQWWDSIGYDYHQVPNLNESAQGANDTSSTLQHFELNGVLHEDYRATYSLPDHVFYGLMRTLQAKYNIPNMYIGN